MPHGIDDYYKARPKLAIPKEKVLPIDDTIRIVETAAPFKELFDEGNATIVQAVGYPNPNRSHFVSMDYWHTVAALINAGFPARVYYVSQAGFDTHFGQKNAHPGLMTEWSQAVKAFHDDLVRLKQDHRVLMLTFSEFGR